MTVAEGILFAVSVVTLARPGIAMFKREWFRGAKPWKM